MTIEEILKDLPKAPAGVEKWIHKDVILKSYIIYSKKENKAVCTRCGHEFRADRFEMKHDEKGKCPKCKSEGMYKSAGRGRKGLYEMFRVLIFARKGDNVYAALWEVTANFEGFGKPELSRRLSAVYFFSEKERLYYKHYPGWEFGGETWKKMKIIRLTYPPLGLYGNTKFHSTEIYEKNLQSVFENSCLRYAWSEDFLKRADLNAYGYIEYVNLHLKYKSIELLRKAGLERLVIEKICGENTWFKDAVNWRGKSLGKILRLPRRQIRKIAQMDISRHELAAYKSLSEKERDMPDELLNYVLVRNYNVEKLKEKTELTKWCAYAHRQNEEWFFSNDWLDYISAAEKIGRDVTKKEVLFPKDFWHAHDEAADILQIQQNKELDQQIKAHTADVTIEGERLIMKMARSQAELNRESEALHHCVKQYGERIAKGQSYIFFIRAKESINTPYFTLEANPKGSIVQCRGDRNCQMTGDVESFVQTVKGSLPKIIEEIRGEYHE